MKIKHLFLTLILVSLLSGQWVYRNGGNEFDGQYRFGYVYGLGNESLYNKPIFAINLLNEHELNIYLQDIGYLGCSNNKIKIKFEGDNNFYESAKLSTDREEKTLFIHSFNGLSKYGFLKKLMNSSKFHVRVTNDCFQRDFSFSLSGSSKAINFVLGDSGKFMFTEYKIRLYVESTLKKINEMNFDELEDFYTSMNIDSVMFTSEVKSVISFAYDKNDKIITDLKIKSGETIKFLNHFKDNKIRFIWDDNTYYREFDSFYLSNENLEIIYYIALLHNNITHKLKNKN